MKDPPNDAIASTAPIRKCYVLRRWHANARLGQLWFDALAAERGAAASTLQTSRDDLATAAVRLIADTQLERLTARYDPLRTLDLTLSWSRNLAPMGRHHESRNSLP